MTQLSRRETFPSMDRFLTRFLNDPLFEALPAVTTMEEGTLALDVSEDEKNVIVRASLPGFRKEDVQIEVHDGVLSIKAEQTEEKEESGERFYRKERRFGSVSRRVALPSAVREDDAKAELKDGVLILRLPKTKEATPRKISIN